MSEANQHTVQLGRQSVIGTSVAATVVYPVDTGWVGFETDRANESPDEDFGDDSREQPGRETSGVRLATGTLPVTARYEDLMHPLDMHAHAISGGTPSGTASPYSWVWTLGGTAAQKMYTVEYGVVGSTQDEWEATGTIANGLELGFDALSAPGNSMWKASMELLAIDAAPATMTTSLSAPTNLETIEGHLTRLYQGPSGTAFASLPELTGLKAFSFNSTRNNVGRAYGGTADLASAWGFSAHGEMPFTATVSITSSSKSGVLDIYRTAQSVVVERRWRVKATGDGVNSFTVDGRVRFRSVPIGLEDGERLYAVSGVFVKDATLGGRAQFTLTNAVATFPT